MPSFKFLWAALHNFSQKNKKNTPGIWLFWQRNIFGTKFGSFCIIQKRFGHNWIKDGHAVRFYFWALFANLNFLNFIACAIVQCGYERQTESELSHECETTKNQAEGLCACFISCTLPGVASQSQAEKEKRANMSVLFFPLGLLIFVCYVQTG